MKVLIYSGYYKEPWGPNNMRGTGGTEIAISQISNKLSKFGWDIVVSGNVISQMVDGVEWIETKELHEKHFNSFDIIIGVSYLHFVLEFEEYDAKKIFWVHNTDFYPWYMGTEIQDPESLLTPLDIDQFVCLTNWHKEQWSQKYSIDPERISVIGNGLNPEEFITNIKKEKGRFIWSSSQERGLTELISNWQKIRNEIPHATLHVYSPPYDIAERLNYNEYDLEGIEFMGSVTPNELHIAMQRAEYWMYLTEYEETYCITALEMQKSNVIPIVTCVAALEETVNSGIIVENNKTKWEFCIQLLRQLSDPIKDKVISSNQNWVKMQTWNMRSYDWKQLIESHVSR